MIVQGYIESIPSKDIIKLKTEDTTYILECKNFNLEIGDLLYGEIDETTQLFEYPPYIKPNPHPYRTFEWLISHFKKYPNVLKLVAEDLKSRMRIAKIGLYQMLTENSIRTVEQHNNSHIYFKFEQLRNMYRNWYHYSIRRRLLLLGWKSEDVGYKPSILLEQVLKDPFRYPRIIPFETACQIYLTERGDIFDWEYNLNSLYYTISKWMTSSQSSSCPLSQFQPEQQELIQNDPRLVIMDDTIYFCDQFQQEQTISEYLKALSQRPPAILQLKSIPSYLTSTQRFAISRALTYPVVFITGGAGTGKTTLLRELITQYTIYNKMYACLSFTGKAVSRIREVLKSDVPMTIHRFLMTSPDPHLDVIVIDEVGMLTTGLFYQLITHLGRQVRFVFIGDLAQLPPIESGYFAHHLAEWKALERIHLEQPHRFSNPEFYQVCNSIRNGKCPIPETMLFQDDIVEWMLKDTTIGSRVVLCPWNSETETINQRIVERLEGKTYMDEWNRIWKKGQRVIMSKNNYEHNLMNGTEGCITDIDVKTNRISVQFGEKTFIYYGSSKRASSPNHEEVLSMQYLTTRDLETSYALTIHRSQGSEWQQVLLYLPMERMETGGSFVNRPMIYTAITRAKTQFYYVGKMEDMEKSVERYDEPHLREVLYKILNKV